jgi:hypothetical protein
MTGQAAERPVTDRPASRALLGAASVVAGAAAAWAATAMPSAQRPSAGPFMLLAGLGVVLAAGNGYGKAYSP